MGCFNISNYFVFYDKLLSIAILMFITVLILCEVSNRLAEVNIRLNRSNLLQTGHEDQDEFGAAMLTEMRKRNNNS
jgi:hypothetical protein